MSEGILLASHYIRKFGRMDAGSTGPLSFLRKMLGPPLAIRAQLEWVFDKASGEEVCAVLCREEAPSVS